MFTNTNEAILASNADPDAKYHDAGVTCAWNLDVVKLMLIYICECKDNES